MTRHVAFAGLLGAREAKLRTLPLILVALACAPRVASAAEAPLAPSGSSNAAMAEKLFYEARQLMDQKKYAEACPKLEQSLKLDDGIGTRFNLANCNEHLGKLASAYNGFTEVAAQAKSVGQTEREQIARKRAQGLEAKVPKLVVEVDAMHDPSLEVKHDDVVVPPSSWGTPIMVDAGTRTVRATAVGKQPWETTIALNDGKTTKVSVPRELLPMPVAASPPVVPPAPPPGVVASTGEDASAATRLTSDDFPAPLVEKSGKPQRTAGYVVGGLGLVGLGVGGFFGLRSLAKKNDAKDHCVEDACDAEGVQLRRDAISNGNAATIGTIVGGAALVTGLVLVLTAPKDRNTAPSVGAPGTQRDVARASIRPSWGFLPGGGSVGVEGVLP